MKTFLNNRRILVGLSGGIACYKSCELVSLLYQYGAQVRVVMTDNACEFVGPTTLQALSGHPVYTDTFATRDPGGIDHVRLSEFAEILAVVPATADIIAKMAVGLADDLLSTTYLALDCPVLAVPAMNTRMYGHPATQANLATLEARGVHVLHPETGHLACGTEGAGRLPDRDRIVEKIVMILCGSEILSGRTVLVTAGPTREFLDPVRYLSNPSSGRMGFALARSAVRMGASTVHLVTGPTALVTPLGVIRHDVTTAAEMLGAVKPLAGLADLMVMSAAVGDFAPKATLKAKIKKGAGDEGLSLELRQTPDILAYSSRARKKGAVAVGFALETDNELEAAAKKLRAKKLDFIAVNNPLEKDSGFGSETIKATLLDSSGNRVQWHLMDKDELAQRLLELAAEKIAPLK